MNKININMADAVKASVKVSLGIDSNGNVTATGQKVLTDNATGESVDDGSPFSIALSDANQAAIQDAIATEITPVVQAQLVPAATA